MIKLQNGYGITSDGKATLWFKMQFKLVKMVSERKFKNQFPFTQLYQVHYKAI